MALREINLIDPEAQTRRSAHRCLRLWAAGLVLVQILVCGVYIYQDRMILKQKHAVNGSGLVQANLAARVAEIRQVRLAFETLKERQAVIASLARTDSFSDVLTRLMDDMGPGTWLTLLELGGGSEKSALRLKIDGFSASNDELGDFIDRLAAEPIFAAVVLKFAGTENTDEPTTPNPGRHMPIAFQIACDLAEG